MSTLLKRGSKGAAVRELQTLLNARGRSLNVDGDFGPATEAAVRAFQEQRGLTVDGIVGKQTWAALGKEDRPATSALITREVLAKVFPNARADIVAAIVEGAAEIAAAGITTPLRAAHFLAQIGPETGGLRLIEESLNYSVAGLLSTFGRHRISAADCERLGRRTGHPADQPAIANLVYGGDWGRKNLGNTEPGDGWRYRGSGLMQTTGRANYRRAGAEANPEALRQPGPALTSALKFWTDNRLNALADRDDVTAVRKAVNGGSNGLDEARAVLAKAKRALGI